MVSDPNDRSDLAGSVGTLLTKRVASGSKATPEGVRISSETGTSCYPTLQNDQLSRLSRPEVTSMRTTTGRSMLPSTRLTTGRARLFVVHRAEATARPTIAG